MQATAPLELHHDLARLVDDERMVIAEPAGHALGAHAATRHERSRDFSNLQDTLDLEVHVALEVERQLALIRNPLAVAYDKVLVPFAAGRLHKEAAIAWSVLLVHETLRAARI